MAATRVRERDYLEHYREHGYAVLRRVFAPAELAELAQSFDRAYAEGIAHGRSFRHGNLFYRVVPDAGLGRVVRYVQWPSWRDPVLERYRRDPRMLDILRPLIGSELKQIINQLHWKPPGAAFADFAFHQDVRFRRPRSAFRDLAGSYVQTGIAIDPHCAGNGAMTMLPGSHRLGELEFGAGGRIMDAAMADADLLRLGLDPTRAVALEMEPGDVALWSVMTVHGSGPNRSDGDRRLYINGYVAAANSDRGEWAFRQGRPCPLPETPSLVHYEDLLAHPGPHYVD
jgi:ectoine hydroxylase-related dioxygenase (phytanoyl-CoA dioxygenase family)